MVVNSKSKKYAHILRDEMEKRYLEVSHAIHEIINDREEENQYSDKRKKEEGDTEESAWQSSRTKKMTSKMKVQSQTRR